MNRLTELYGKRIYTEDSEYLGVAKDVIIEPQEGRIKFLVKADISSILGRDEAEAKAFIKKNAIPFDRVVATGDIIIVKSRG